MLIHRHFLTVWRRKLARMYGPAGNFDTSKITGLEDMPKAGERVTMIFVTYLWTDGHLTSTQYYRDPWGNVGAYWWG